MKTTQSFHNPSRGKFDTMTHVHSVSVREPDHSIDWTPVLVVVAIVVSVVAALLYYNII